VIEWLNTKSHWLIYLQDLTELAYFKGNIRRCSYVIAWEDNNGIKHETYAALSGPQESTIHSSAAHGLSFDAPNYSLHLLLPKNQETLQYFSRYAKFYL
jgi:hypothetical protein